MEIVGVDAVEIAAGAGHAASQSGVVRERAGEALPSAAIPFTTGALPVSFEKSILGGALGERLLHALSARGLDGRELRRPGRELLIFVADAARVAQGKQEMANLVASAMDPKFGCAVLPSHVDVLRQLTLDELALLRVTPPYGFASIVSDLVYVLASGQVQFAYRNIAPTQLAGACSTPSNIPQYIDNLTRLRLIYNAGEASLADDVHKSTARIPFVRQLIGRRPAGSKAGMQSWEMRLTDFGEQFRRACLY